MVDINGGEQQEIKKSERIYGLDSLRFVCAVIVMIGHYSFELPEPFGENAQGLFKVLRGVLNCLFNGPAAVIVFFVISGFCIHFPNRKSGRVDLGSFYCKRMIRIGVPAIVAAFICLSCGCDLKPPDFGVYWSIICEVVYYLIYPMLLVLKRRTGWGVLVVTSYVVALLICLLNLQQLEEFENAYVAFVNWSWVIGLPCWLLGCWLAENYTRFTSPTPLQMWLLRFTILLITDALQILKFHAHSVFASYCFTLNFFAIVVYFWIGYEIAYSNLRAPNRLLEQCGKWSYSLYLLHVVSPHLFNQTSSYSIVPHQVVWICASFIVSYLFYLIVERPSHQLAVRLGSRLSCS